MIFKPTPLCIIKKDDRLTTLLTSFVGVPGGTLKWQELNISLKNGKDLHFQKVLHFSFYHIMESCTSLY